MSQCDGWKFDFDPTKNARNLAKHGISFTAASLAFNDSNALISFDELHSDTEDRFTLLATVGSHILFIVYTMRGEVDKVDQCEASDEEGTGEVLRKKVKTCSDIKAYTST